jgi:PAS domain S-box-containing protein
VENSPDAIYIQTEGRFTYLNKAAVHLLGADHRDDLMGKSVVERVHPAFQENIRKRMRQLNQGRGGIPRQVEICMQRLDNTPVNVETSAVPLEYGGQKGALVFVRDMTEFHRAQLRHQELESQLYQAQKMEAVGRLAGGVAHDFNNLLAIVLGYVELMLEDFKVKRSHRDHLETIYNAAKRASDLTRQLLAFSRKQILEMKTASVNAIITGFEKLLRRLIGEDIKLELLLIPENPLVRADTAQMEQVLMNLAVNARDAMPEGGVLTIKTSMEEISAAQTEQIPGMKAGSNAMIEVRDTGCGMYQETLMNIFEPFFTTKGKEKGTGLGLATSYGIIKQHGGYIGGGGESGKGATFKIYLPLVTGSVISEEKVTLEVEPVSRATTVLVVEDDPAVRSLVCTFLHEAGYRVIQADSPEDAISRAVDQESNIHLVLTDVVMPGMKGPEVYEKIRGSHPESKVLYMSGYTDEVIVHHGVLMEGIDFIHKPFTTRKLLNKVSKVLHEA